jgi:hypothetical protein
MIKSIWSLEILAGLPAVGEPAVQFSASGMGTHREGLVAGISSVETGVSWVGNFQRGMGRYDAALAHPNGTDAIVVAGGQIYDVDPERRFLNETFAGMVDTITPVPDLNLYVFGTSIDFQAIGPNGRVWRSGRIALDGIRSLSLEGTTLKGEAYDLGDRWLRFSLDVRSGRHTGGAAISW